MYDITLLYISKFISYKYNLVTHLEKRTILQCFGK
jgi:hypothetical protein